MGLWNNIKTFVNVGFLAGTDMTVEKAFGDYESAAQAQADVNRLSAIMDSSVIGKRFSKRKTKEQLFLEDILGEPELPEMPKLEPKPELNKETLIEWFNSLPTEDKEFVKNALK